MTQGDGKKPKGAKSKRSRKTPVAGTPAGSEPRTEPSNTPAAGPAAADPATPPPTSSEARTDAASGSSTTSSEAPTDAADPGSTTSTAARDAAEPDSQTSSEAPTAAESGPTKSSEARTDATESGSQISSEARTDGAESGSQISSEARTDDDDTGSTTSSEARTDAAESGSQTSSEARTDAAESGSQTSEARTDAAESSSQTSPEARTDAAESGLQTSSEARTDAADPGSQISSEAPPVAQSGSQTSSEARTAAESSSPTTSTEARTDSAASASPTTSPTTSSAATTEAAGEAAGERTSAPSIEEVARIAATAVAEAQAIAAWDDPEAASLPAPEPIGAAGLATEPSPSPRAQSHDEMLDPASAAFEAARIAGEIVGDIESRSGAAIVAAAAAGAAIEAARARRAAVTAAGAAAQAAAPASGTMPPTAGAALTGAEAASAAASAVASVAAAGATDPEPGDPVVTVRMQRDRILRALAEDIAANTTGEAPSEVRPGGRVGHARATGQGRAVSASGIEAEATAGAGAIGAAAPGTAEDLEEDELDPVQVAAAAIRRMRQRASTDFAELRTHYHRHDILVLVVAFVIIVVAGRVHDRLVTPDTVPFKEHGLRFQYSLGWSPLEPMLPNPPRIMRDQSGLPPKADSSYHVSMTSTQKRDPRSQEPVARIEVLVDKKPAWRNVVTGLELDRRNRWGEMYSLEDSSVRAIEAQNWLRTAYRYAHAPAKGGVPRVDRAIEYATEDRDQLYVVTMFGSDSELERIESVVAPTLRVATKTGLPLVPQTRSLAQKKQTGPVANAFPSTVMIVVADMIDGKLRARGGGSGVIVGKDGSILTNYHVIHDKDGRLHDVFVIGRFGSRNRAPQLTCAGRPSRSKLQREIDLALIKCDTDLDGRTWTPPRENVDEARNTDVRMGQKLWVLGYPDVGGGGLTISEGEVSGWTGLDGTAGRDFIKTDAAISRGNSGGPVIDDAGKLVGIASASRTKVLANASIVEVSQIGLVRPIATADCLTSIATIGWIPREGSNDCELQPSAVEAPTEGVRIETRIVDQANKAPIGDALVMVFRPGISASEIDVNQLDEQVLAWGRSISTGDVELKQPVPVPGTYTVIVVGRGYRPMIGQDALRLDDKTPPAYDPWGEIRLLAR